MIEYPANGAKQLGIEDAKGSIAVGKNAEFLVFDNDLLTRGMRGSATISRGTCTSLERR